MKLLLVEDDPDVLDFVTTLISTKFDVDIVSASNVQSAFELIKANADLGLVICDYSLIGGNGGDVYTFLINTRPGVPFILCSSEVPTNIPAFENQESFAGYVLKPDISLPLTKFVEQIVTGSLKIAEEDFVPLSLYTIYKVRDLKYDVYLRINEQKFIKVYAQGSQFTIDDYHKLLSKEVSFLYVHREQVGLLLNGFAQNVKESREKINLEFDDSNIFISDSVKELLEDIANCFDWPHEVYKMLETNVNVSIRALNKELDLKETFLQLNKKSNNKVMDKAVVSGVFVCGILHSLNWENNLQLFKLVLATMVRFLGMDEDLIDQIDEFEDELLYGSIKQSARFAIFKKAMDDVTAKFEALGIGSVDLVKILRQQYERPDGTGFPFGLKATRIEPMAAIMNTSIRLGHSVPNYNVRDTLEHYFETESEEGTFGTIKLSLNQSFRN